MSDNYNLQPNDTVTSSQEPTKDRLMHDFNDDYRNELKVQVASGDYFILLATKLDELSAQITDTSPDTHTALERIIADLTFLQKEYAISKKD